MTPSALYCLHKSCITYLRKSEFTTHIPTSELQNPCIGISLMSASTSASALSLPKKELAHEGRLCSASSSCPHLSKFVRITLMLFPQSPQNSPQPSRGERSKLSLHRSVMPRLQHISAERAARAEICSKQSGQYNLGICIQLERNTDGQTDQKDTLLHIPTDCYRR